jgi:transcriptional regulator with XRE-family HTH domain
MTTTPLWVYVRDVIRGRYPGLSMRKMSLDAGVAENTVLKIKNGHVPKASTLRALAETWGRTTAEIEQDYREMLKAGGLAVPEDRSLGEDEWAMVQTWREMDSEQRERAQRFFQALGTNNALELLTLGIRPYGPTRPTPAETFQQFLTLLQQVSTLTPEECMTVIADSLRRALEKDRQDHIQDSLGE